MRCCTYDVNWRDIKYQYDKNITIGIQIQGNQYRKIIEGADEKNVFSKAEELKDSLFSFPNSLNQKGKIRPSNSNEKLEELVKLKNITKNFNLDFNKYHIPTQNHLFLYQYVVLDNTNTTNEEFVKIVCEDIYNIIEVVGA